MSQKLLIALLVLFTGTLHFNCKQNQSKLATVPPEYAFVIHGGAGTILKANMSDEMEKAYYEALDAALDIGEEILRNGGTCIDAVEKSLRLLEDSPLFNAGKGAVFTHEGINEMDASFMNGADLNAGAISGVRNLKHPISAARAVMEKSEHVMLTGDGAEEFAISQGIETVDPSYFYTERRWNALQNLLNETGEKPLTKAGSPDSKHGTVGAVALDNYGNIAAGTTTGGMTNKRFNRIGDSPIIGAGTYANNKTCGVSCTGHGEFFIRYAVAHDLSARMEYTGEDIKTAADYIIHKKLLNAGGEGGLVALDRNGNIAMTFNSEGMYRGYVKPNERYTAIYKSED